MNPSWPILISVRDRALISVVVPSFARASTALAIKVKDYYTEAERHGSACTRRAASGTRCPPIITKSRRMRSPYRSGRHRRREEKPPLPHHRQTQPVHRPPDAAIMATTALWAVAAAKYGTRCCRRGRLFGAIQPPPIVRLAMTSRSRPSQPMTRPPR